LDSRADGLTVEEVDQRRKLYGLNTFKTSKKSALTILVRQFRNAIIYLLIAASLASFLSGDYMDGFVVTAILLLNALLGFVQEYRSERALEALVQLVKHHVIIKRDGKNVVLEQDQLVPGDVVVIKEGDIVPADSKLLQTEGFLVDEAALSGESVPVAKTAEPSSTNPEATLVFAGTVAQKGEAVAVVYATGEATELGQIAHLSTSTEKVTQYGKSLESFSFLLMKIALLLIPPIFIVKILFLGGSTSFADNLVFMFAFAIAVAPEALPVIVTVTLASGALLLAKRHVVVRELAAMEDFGNITLLCTDKTGTLTENKLTVTDMVAENPEWLQVLAYASIEK
jgi:P-type E1-E2 ATPase